MTRHAMVTRIPHYYYYYYLFELSTSLLGKDKILRKMFEQRSGGNNIMKSFIICSFHVKLSLNQDGRDLKQHEAIEKCIYSIKVKVKVSRYTPWRHMGGEEV
jgi:hypothetical protein